MEDKKNYKDIFASIFRMLKNYINSKITLYYFGSLVIFWALNKFLIATDISIKFSEYENVLTVLFGLTAGILTFVGLIAIYISVNTQHSIQKCRELEWESMELAASPDNIKRDAKLLNKKIKLYGDILINSGRRFNKEIVKITQEAIIIVGLIWLITVNFFLIPKQSITEYLIVACATFFSIALLSKFHSFIGMMNEIVELGNIKQVDELLSVKSGDFNLRQVLLLGNNELEIWSNPRNMNWILTLRIKTPIPEFSVVLNRITFRNSNGEKIDTFRTSYWFAQLLEKRENCEVLSEKLNLFSYQTRNISADDYELELKNYMENKSLYEDHVPLLEFGFSKSKSSCIDVRDKDNKIGLPVLTMSADVESVELELGIIPLSNENSYEVEAEYNGFQCFIHTDSLLSGTAKNVVHNKKFIKTKDVLELEI